MRVAFLKLNRHWCSTCRYDSASLTYHSVFFDLFVLTSNTGTPAEFMVSKLRYYFYFSSQWHRRLKRQ